MKAIKCSRSGHSLCKYVMSVSYIWERTYVHISRLPTFVEDLKVTSCTIDELDRLPDGVIT